MPINQRTLNREKSISKALHTGEDVTLTLKPAPASSGFVFRRTDLYGKPEIKPLASSVTELIRSTTISNGNAKIHTIEHVLVHFLDVELTMQSLNLMRANLLSWMVQPNLMSS